MCVQYDETLTRGHGSDLLTCSLDQVIEVQAKKRIGSHSLVTALRKTLEAHYPDKSLALGGTFIIQKGKAKIHIMVLQVALHC